MKTFRSTFVRNATVEAVRKDEIQRMVTNLLPKMVRMDKMEDRDYIVVPMVILTEGVHHGSEGPMLYSKEELAKVPCTWNHKPVVVYHPELNGQGITACDPDVITNRKVGVMMNTKFESGKLKSEAWIEKERANLVDERIMAAIENNEMMELSTGVFVDMEETEGEWNGESYIGIARNFRPDHLALLPDKIGACSIADGAGFLRNQSLAGTDNKKHAGVLAFFRNMVKFASNELSFDSTRESLSQALRTKFKVNQDKGPYLWVADVYSNFVVYEYNNKLFRIGYTSNDTTVRLDDEEPVEVKRVTEYRSVTGALVGNGEANNTKTDNMKKQLIDGLISNKASGFTEADREKLNGFSEDQLKSVSNAFTPKKEEPAPTTNNAPAPPAAPVTAPVAPAAPAVTANSAKVVTLQDYIAAAPSEIQDVLNSSVEIFNEEKNRLVGAILANKEAGFTKEELNSRPLSELRKLARLSGAGTAATVGRSPNFGGQGSVADLATNQGEEEPLEVPALNFSKAAAN